MEIRFISSKQVRAPADAELPLPVVRAPDLSGRVLGARYSLRRRIGGGSMGTVYEARDMTLGTAVAVKVLHPDYCGDEDFRRRFHQEALLGARLRHEHSVAVTDLGQSDDGLLYSVMEYLEGESLDGLLSSRPGPLPWRRVVTIAVQVCAALQAAHDRGVIHRDIKPGNCFLVRREGHRGADDSGADDGPPFTFVKVLDLGLARLMPSTGRPTPPGRLGAPEYLAPEQIQGFTCDHRVDVYALGVLMYKLLTRRLPFTGDNPAAIMRMHIETPPAPPRRVAPAAEIPASLEAVVLRALAKDRADRYPSAHMMAQAIRAAAADAEAEAIAIDEAPDDPASGPWRAGATGRAPPRVALAGAAPVSTSLLLVPGFGYGPNLRSGLIGLLVALASILVASAWASERTSAPPATPPSATHDAAPMTSLPATTGAAPVVTVTPMPPLPATAGTAALATVAPIPPLAGPLGPAELADGWVASVLVEDGRGELRSHEALVASRAGASVAGPPAVAAPAALTAVAGAPVASLADASGSGAPAAGSLASVAGASASSSGAPAAVAPERRAGRGRPGGASAPVVGGGVGSDLLPGAPTLREFTRHLDMVAPGVHRCMRHHCPDRGTLTVELTVGGPRRTAVALGLPEHDTPAMRACLAPLLARLSFTPTQQTARYRHVYRP